MEKYIKEFLEINSLYPGQIYKVCPDRILKDFVKYVESKEETSKVACFECAWEGIEKELSIVVKGWVHIKSCPNCGSEELIDL